MPGIGQKTRTFTMVYHEGSKTHEGREGISIDRLGALRVLRDFVMDEPESKLL